jgi:hypothetical protein
MRELRQALKQAHRHGDKVGELMVRVKFKYVPCGGTTNTQVRRYTLKLR